MQKKNRWKIIADFEGNTVVTKHKFDALTEAEDVKADGD